ncbi:MAG: hypothetical protein GXY86_17850 [Firmicutes bacterium]|jgi:hypothetical protein|nr:hypothetical protein [Bacillota bacterium]
MNKKVRTLLDDNIPYKNWRVAACLGKNIWLHLSAPLHPESPKGYDVSTLYEINLETYEWDEIYFQKTPYILWNLYATENYLYASILTDIDQDGIITDKDYDGGMKLILYNRTTRETSILYTFPSNCFLPNIKQVIDENQVLLCLSFKNEKGEILERYDLLDIANNQLQTLYIDNEEMLDCNIFLAKGSNGKVVVVKDLHVTPSDKPRSNGKADRILVLMD